MREFVSFRRMITPAVIHTLFWIGAAASLFLAAAVGARGVRDGDAGAMLAGALLLLGGPLVVRVHCELVMVLFRIHDLLAGIRTDLRDAPRRQGP